MKQMGANVITRNDRVDDAFNSSSSGWPDVRSREWISENKVTRDQVENPDKLGLPYFGTAWAFGDWIKAQSSRKPFTEWNGTIYHTADIVAHTLPDMPGLAVHLPT